MMRPASWLNLGWLLVIGTASSVWCATACEHLGSTFDELLYVQIGLDGWRTGSPKRLMFHGVMSLPADVQTLPVYLIETWRGEPFDPIRDNARLLPVVRAGTLVFWWLLLIYAFRWGALCGGDWGGRLASGFVATDPNLIGHAALATTDIALAATVLVAVYHFHRGRDRGPWRRVVLPGVLYGVALSAKASALAFVPLLAVALELHRLVATGQLVRPARPLLTTLGAWRRATLRLRWDLVYVFFVAVAWVLFYTGTDWQPEPQFTRWASELQPGPGRDAAEWLTGRATACFPNAVEGLARQIDHSVKGHQGCYIFGERYPDGRWFFFPGTLLVKLPDSALLLVPLAFLLNPRVWRSPLVFAVLVLLLFSLTTRVQIGIRIVFPLVVILHIALAVALATAPRRLLARGLGLLAVGYAAALAVQCWPDGIRFTNQLWGGPDRGAKWLSDSNYDWGQGLPDLKGWHAANGEPDVFVWFFGTDPQQHRPPFHSFQVHDLPVRSPAVVRERVGGGYLAVSVSVLNSCLDRRPDTQAVIDWLKSMTPVARTRTMFLYRLE